MKFKLFLYGMGLAALALVVAVIVFTNWNVVGTIGWENRDTSANYTLDVNGKDIRVYEFSPLTLPNHSCIVTGSSNNTTLFCGEINNANQQEEKL
jgi:uncharacterized protein involved in outer membrane biogenesis